MVVDGIDVKKLNHKQQHLFLRNHVSFLFQNYALMNEKSVYENVSIGSKFNSESSINDALETVGLVSFSDRKVQSLSGGEQQRVALARVIVKPSRIIFADEPTGNLDETNAKMVWEILSHLRDKGKTIVVVTHDHQALHYFDRIIQL